MATITDQLVKTWSGSGNASPFNGTTVATGSTAEQIVTTVAATTGGQSQPFPMSYAAMQEFVVLSDQNVWMTVNVAAPYVFTCSSANATIGATYTNNGHTFTVLATLAAGTTLLCSGTGAAGASGTLTKATGTGDATITFSAVASPTAATAVLLQAGQVYDWYVNGYFPNPFSADIVNLYFSNPGATLANLNVRALRT